MKIKGTVLAIIIMLSSLAPLAIAACGSTKTPDGSASSVTDDGGTTDAADANDDTDDAGSPLAIALTACNPNVYSAEMTIGGGSQTFQLLFDTGSTTLAVAAAGCTSCSLPAASLYQPSPTAVDQHMTATAGFGSGTQTSSGWTGEIIKDWVGVGGAASASAKLAEVNLVAMTSQTTFLVGACGSGPPQGVIGFAPSSIEVRGTNGFFDQVVAAHDGGVRDLFATRFCSHGGTLWIGGYDPSFLTAPPAYTPMLSLLLNGQPVQAWYTVSFASIAVSGATGTTVPIPTDSFNGAMLDTGSSWSSLPPAAFEALTSAIASDQAFTQIFGAASSSFFSSLNNCTALSQTKDALDAALPPLTLTFGTSPSAITVRASATESYLLTHGDGRWCPALTPLAPSSTYPNIAAHLGAPMLSSNIVIFDRANQRVGFAPHTACP